MLNLLRIYIIQFAYPLLKNNRTLISEYFIAGITLVKHSMLQPQADADEILTVLLKALLAWL